MPGMRITNSVAWDTTNTTLFKTANTNFDSDIMYNDVKAAVDKGEAVGCLCCRRLSW